MSNQIVISSGAKVRELEGVLTGTSGIVSSVPLGAANGVATLDSGGKVPVSQLPSSVVTYLGTWNAATNTPTLVNGTGDAGDMYICNVAGTVNFGAGPVTFAVGDWVLYGSGTWQKSSGQNGTVTSVAASITGNAVGLTGSPITTAGTLAFAFAGTNLQYVNGAGNLTTFPTISAEAQRLITEVYNETGATLTKGTVVYINGGHGNLPTITKAIATGDATSAQTYGIVQTDITNNNNGYVVVIGSLTNLDTQAYANGTQLYLSSTTAGAWTSTKQYAPAHLVYVGIVTRSHPTQGVVEVRIQNGFEMDELHNVSAQSPLNNQGLFYNTSTSLWENKSIATALGYTPISLTSLSGGAGISYNNTTGVITNSAPDQTVSLTAGSGISVSGTYPSFTIASTITQYTDALARAAISLTTTGTSGAATYNNTTGVFNIPNYTTDLSNYVDLTTAQTIGGTKTFSNATKNDGGIFLQNGSSNALAGYMNLGGLTNGLKFTSGGGISNTFTLPSATGYTFTFPSATGTIALTSDLTGGTVTSVAMTVPTGLSVSGSPITTSGTLAVSLASGYSIPTTASQATWDTAYTNRITSLTTTGTSGAATLVANVLNIPNYSFTETDTLATVVARGASTFQTISVGNGATGATGINILRGRLCFSDTYEANHSIYNDYLNIDSEGSWDGMKMNVFLGLDIRTGNAVGAVPSTIVTVRPAGVVITGTLTATSFVKTSGTSSQFLKADGSVDSSTYALDSAVVHNTGNETVGGTKTFSDTTKNNGGIFLQNASSNSLAGYMNIGGLTNGIKFTSGGGISNIFTLPSATGYTFTFPNATGTLALTSDVPILSGTAPISYSAGVISISQATTSTNGYLSSTDWNTFNLKQAQLNGTGFVKATGTTISYDNSTYLTTSSAASIYLPLAGGTLTGALSGTSATFYIGDDINGTYFLGGSGNTARQLKFSTSTTTNVGDTHTIDAQSGTGVLQFSVTSSPKMTILSSGNVGIGTSTPTYKFETLGASVITAAFGRSDYGASNVMLIAMNGYRDVYKTAIGVVRTGDYDVADMIFCLNGSANGTVVSASDEKMRIKSVGSLLLGTSTNVSDVRLQVAPSGGAASWISGTFSGSGGTNKVVIGAYSGVASIGGHSTGLDAWANLSINFDGGNVLIGKLTNATGLLQVNGTVYATGFYESSDIRFKNILETNPNVNVSGIDVIKFTRKDKDIDQVRYGYSAQQVQSILPDVVTGDDFLNVNYLDVHTLKIAALEQEIKDLKAKLN